MTFDITEQTDTAGLINHIYTASVAPELMIQLIERWEKRVGIGARTRDLNGYDLSNAIFAGQVEKVVAALDQIISVHDSRIAEFLSGFRSAALIFKASGMVVAANPAAADIFKIMPGHTISDLPFEESDIAIVQASVDTLCASDILKETVLRLHLKGAQHVTLDLSPAN